MTVIRCYTLFDIKDTGISNRRPPADLDPTKVEEWNKNRNRQVNLDTILQIVSLRSQPENITTVYSKIIDFNEFNNFGFLFREEEPQQISFFDFSVNHKNVFDNGLDPLGHLFEDCAEVPMIKIGTEWDKLPNFLDTSPELKNIHFEVLENE